jgi:uncharacterized Tic20 family protein
MDPTQDREGLGSYVAGTGDSITGGPGGTPTADDKTMGMLAHVGAALGTLIGLPFLAPLILLLTKGKESAFIRYHAVESLNLQITSLIPYFVLLIVAVVTCGIGAFLIPIVTVGVAVLNIIAGIKAHDGELYRYPVPMVRLIK